MNGPSDFSRAFALRGHVFQCFMPSSDAETLAWLIVVTMDRREVRRETLSMRRYPNPEPSAADVASRDARLREIVVELGLGQAGDV